MTYNTLIVAEIHPDRPPATAAWITRLPEDHPVRRFVMAMVQYGVQVAASEHRAPSQGECEIYARACLIPGELFGLARRVGDHAAGEQLGIPVDQLISHRRDHGYDEQWNPVCARRPACETRRRRRPPS